MRTVLGIETSCDETAAAVVVDGRSALSNIVASQMTLHQAYGGVVPEIASRQHLDAIADVVARAVEPLDDGFRGLDGIAVTYGPGLVGALLVGLSYAKALALTLGVPFVGVHHIEGHMFSTTFEYGAWDYPALALIVSGGHTDLFHIAAPFAYERIGHTRDDAAGEAYDKTARRLGLGYPGGPILDRLARAGQPDHAPLVYRPPLIPDAPYDFSFSGLKTAVLRYIREHQVAPLPEGIHPEDISAQAPDSIRNLAASFQRAVVNTLVGVLERAIDAYHPRLVVTGGGVVCNTGLRQALADLAHRKGIEIRVPHPKYTTDNAAMIAAAGYARLARGERHDWSLEPAPSLRLGQVPAEHSRHFRA
ncbi:MAG: tRNA (adenosine(37)-N6)-threonylcarbamoyltransferase complex transferase subunit TsaD [Chloracidobacterium sp.]|uniref:tRNA N6-adenosine threonylcarbamoyltransferase n=1 Tax=Chloracidobacterium validum TaxID=2821543 RepID=A0ABX8B804_9BACT|nr:tRNA (adenosine(37)-N6)-threonylcarbamoyltransferase complex transferase subunit TsaD [Chloracidobacterium validum]QUW03086.1 tRNA (adenosine(37)-N6)-threonylcarbamoyltransferase complex transferase subunit TsaD [Chloracidobacterium validum]